MAEVKVLMKPPCPMEQGGHFRHASNHVLLPNQEGGVVEKLKSAGDGFVDGQGLVDFANQ
jgi:hypothetical protein